MSTPRPSSSFPNERIVYEIARQGAPCLATVQKPDLELLKEKGFTVKTLVVKPHAARQSGMGKLDKVEVACLAHSLNEDFEDRLIYCVLSQPGGVDGRDAADKGGAIINAFFDRAKAEQYAGNSADVEARAVIPAEVAAEAIRKLSPVERLFLIGEDLERLQELYHAAPQVPASRPVEFSKAEIQGLLEEIDGSIFAKQSTVQPGSGSHSALQKLVAVAREMDVDLGDYNEVRRVLRIENPAPGPRF